MQITSKRDNLRRGFTLIELLVVIAIIAILAAILFPVFARARENARRASCMSNLKQIGLGIMQYTQDYDERYPLSWYGRGDGTGYTQTQAGTPGTYFKICDPSSCAAGTGGSIGGGNWITWMDLIFPYVKSTQLFVCPSSVNPLYAGARIPNYWLSGAYGNTVFTTLDSTTPGSYATSTYGNPIVQTGTPMSAILRPAETVMTFEATATTTTILYFIRGAASSPVTVGWEPFFQPHLEGLNLAYGDGHVKWKPYANLAAELGPPSTAGCNLSSITNIPHCSKLWNPFRP